LIVVDTSALMAALLREEGGDRCRERMSMEQIVMMSAGTLAEALVVAGQRDVAEKMAALVTEAGISVIPVDEAGARAASRAYASFGRGNHPARLNYGDCFAYALAHARDCPLLFVGDGFSQTDVEAA